jgi:hypothetical protein
MLYMVELRYQPEQRERALQYFQQHGTTGYEGKVTLNGAWVATQERIAFAIVEAASQDEMNKACVPLREFGEVKFLAITSFDQL